MKSIRRAAAAGRPTEEGLLVAEGPNLLREALRGKWALSQIFCTEAAWRKHGELLRSARTEVVQVSARALGGAAETETSQEIITLLQPCRWTWPDLLTAGTLLVVLDGIQDPGNAGTIVRSAEAFGATGIILLQGSTGVANGKFLRASAGSIFRLPFLDAISPSDLLDQAARSRVTVFALDMRRSVSLADADFTASCALIIGSEGSGIRPELLEGSRAISIPTRKVESLNAAVACSIALHTAFHQRSRR